MADSHANLTNNGLTTNFDVSHDDSIDRQANVIDNANALAVVENEFTVTTGWFGVPASKFGTGHRQRVKLDLADTVPRIPQPDRARAPVLKHREPFRHRTRRHVPDRDHQLLGE